MPEKKTLAQGQRKTLQCKIANSKYQDSCCIQIGTFRRRWKVFFICQNFYIEILKSAYGNEATGSNAAILQKESVIVKKVPTVRRKLSKKKRKHLEKLIDQKEKKAQRGELLERLAKLQVPTSELEKYKSIAHLGTNHTHKALAKLPDKNFTNKVNTIKGRKRKIDEKTDSVENEAALSSSDEEMSEEEERIAEVVQEIENAEKEEEEEPTVWDFNLLLYLCVILNNGIFLMRIVLDSSFFFRSFLFKGKKMTV